MIVTVTTIIFFSLERRKNFNCVDQDVNDISRNGANHGRSELHTIIIQSYLTKLLVRGEKILRLYIYIMYTWNAILQTS